MKHNAKFITLVLSAILLSTCITSCKKYPEGPAFSLLTKKARLCGTWQMDKYLVNGKDQTTFFNTVLSGYQIEIKKDETYKSTALSGIIEEGKWKFANNKEHLISTVNTTGVETDNQILKLKDKELWLKQTSISNDIIELHLKAK